MRKRKLKAPLKSVGHSIVRYKVVPKSKLNKLKKGTRIYIKVRGVRKKVTKGNINPYGSVGHYRRSDTKTVALRNYATDRSRKATHKAMKKRGYSGD